MLGNNPIGDPRAEDIVSIIEHLGTNALEIYQKLWIRVRHHKLRAISAFSSIITR